MICESASPLTFEQQERALKGKCLNNVPERVFNLK